MGTIKLQVINTRPGFQNHPLKTVRQIYTTFTQHLEKSFKYSKIWLM